MKTAAELAQKGKFATLKGFCRSQTLLTRLRNHQKENQLVITKKHNEHNQKLTKIVVDEWV